MWAFAVVDWVPLSRGFSKNRRPAKAGGRWTALRSYGVENADPASQYLRAAGNFYERLGE
jgi:hypothetical protein